MKKVLSFCVLSVLLAVLSLGLKAQSGLVLTPPNISSPIELDQYDTIYISPGSACFDSLGLSEGDRISIEWQVMRDGSVIPDDSLSYYFETFKFQSLYEGKWWGESYTSAYCRDGNGYGSYPGAHIPPQGLGSGHDCAKRGPFGIQKSNDTYLFDFFFVKWFKDNANTAHRLVYNAKVDGDYQFVFSLAKRTGGTVWNGIAVTETYYVGGKGSQLDEIISSDTVHGVQVSEVTDYFRCLGDSLVLGNPAVTFTVSTDTANVPYDSVFYMGSSSCSGAVDSIVRFRVFFEDPSMPTLDTLHSLLAICDSGTIAIKTTLPNADMCIWLDETFTVLDTLPVADSLIRNINANTRFYALGYNSASGCASSDTLTVYAEVFASPNPVVSAAPNDSICENGTLQITLDQNYDKWKWFHDGVNMQLDTFVSVADVHTTDAGWYRAEVSMNHTHSVYPTIDTVVCSAADSIQITVFERPSVQWVSFDDNTTLTDSVSFCLNVPTHHIVATITGGQAPYDNVVWTGAGGTRVESYNADKSYDTLSITVLPDTCGLAYTVGINYAIDSNGCTLKDSVEFTFFVKDTVAPTIARTVDTVYSTLAYTGCKYIIPDLRSSITTNDNCGILDTVQVPAAGDTVTVDTIVILTVHDLCGNPASDTIKVLLPVHTRPSVQWASLDDNTTVTDSLMFCPTNLNHKVVATVTGGTAPYNNINWTGVAALSSYTTGYNADKSSDTLNFTLFHDCDRTYTVGIDQVIDTNGCTLETPIELTVIVNDTVDPVVTRTVDTMDLIPAYDTLAACEYIIPDLRSYINVVEDCIIKDTVQDPVAGTRVTADTIVIVTVHDSCGRSGFDTIAVKIPVQPLAVDSIKVLHTVSCAGDADGSIRIVVKDGHAPYTVTIQSNEVPDSMYTQTGTSTQTVFDFDGLIKGLWDITVTDSNRCTVAVPDTANVASPDALTLTSIGRTNLTCFEQGNGSLTFRVEKGTKPYSVNIRRTLGTEVGDTTITLNPSILDTTVLWTNQKAGAFVITVTDSNNCVTSINDTLTQPDELHLDGTTVLNQVKCFGDSLGNLAVTGVTGGTLPYHFAWVNTAGDTVSMDSVTNRILPVGYYTIHITDANNCAPDTVLTDTVKGPEKELKVLSVEAPAAGDTCPRLHTYSFNATVEGGRPNYEFEWTFNDVVAQTHTNMNVVADTFDYIEAHVSCDTVFEIIFKVTDDSVCVARDTITFSITDTVKPSLTGTPLDTLYIDGCAVTDANAANGADTLNTIAKLQAAGFTISDNCTDVDALTVNYTEVVTGTCPIEIVRTYSVTDSCGKTSEEVKHVIYVQDTTRPTYTRPNDTILYLDALCQVDTLTTSTGVPTNLSDNCTDAAALAVSHRDEVVDSCGSSFVIYRYWRVEDECHKVSLSDSVQIIEVRDSIKPVFTGHPVSDTAYCDDGIAVVTAQFNLFILNNRTNVTATDNCALDTILMVEDSVVQGCNTATKTYYYSFTAKDKCGNSTVEYATFLILDTVPPTVITPALRYAVQCAIVDVDEARQYQLDHYNISDGCSPNDTVVTDELAPFVKVNKNQVVGYYEHTVTVSDGCQSAVAKDTIWIIDTVRPYFVADGIHTGEKQVRCDGAGNLDTLVQWIYSVQADDECSGIEFDTLFYAVHGEMANLAVFDTNMLRDGFGHYVDAWYWDTISSSNSCKGSYQFVWKVVDSCGNERRNTYLYTIEDETAPVFEVPQDTTIYCQHNQIAFEAWLVLDSAYDACSQRKFEVTFDTVFHAGCGSTGYYDVIWRSVDACGNATNDLTHNAKWTIKDTLPPVVETIDPSGQLAPDTLYYGQNTPYTLNRSLSTWWKTGMNKAASDEFIDAFLNEGVIKDYLNQDHVIPNAAGISAINECGYLKSFLFEVFNETSSVECVDSLRVEYTFTDACDSFVSFTQEVIILDTSAPVFNNIRDIMYLRGPDQSCVKQVVDTFYTVAQLKLYTPTDPGSDLPNVADKHDMNIVLDSIVAVDAFNSCDSVEIRYYTISDVCGNSAVFTQTITYRDTIKPQLNITQMVDSIHQMGIGSCDKYSEIEAGHLYDSLLSETWLYNRYGLVIEDCHNHTISFVNETIDTDPAYCPGKVFVRNYKVQKVCSPRNYVSNFTVRLIVKDTIAPDLLVDTLTPKTVYMKSYEESCAYTVPDVHFNSYDQLVAWQSADVAQDCNLGINGNDVTLCDSVIIGEGCQFDIHYRYTLEDSCGNMSDTIHLFITVMDTLAPNILVDTATTVDTVYFADYNCTFPDLSTKYWTTPAQAMAAGVNMTDCNPKWEDAANITRYDANDTSALSCATYVVVKYAVKDSCSIRWSDTIYQVFVVLDTLAPNVLVDTLVGDTVYTDNDCNYVVPNVHFEHYAQLVAWQGGDVAEDCNLGAADNVTMYDSVKVGDGCEYQFHYRYTVEDSCGNMSDTIHLFITVMDTLAPNILVDTATTVDTVYFADYSCTFPDLSTTYWTTPQQAIDHGVSMTDCNPKWEDGANITRYDANDTSALSCATYVVVKYAVKDSCNTNWSDTIYQMIVVLDTFAPNILVDTLVGDTVYTDNDCNYVVPNVHFEHYAQLVAWHGSDVAEDCNLGATDNVTMYDSVKVGDGCEYQFHYRYTVEDSCGNMSDTIHLFITVMDTLAPNILVDTATTVDTLYMVGYTCTFPDLSTKYWTTPAQAITAGVSMTDCNPKWEDAANITRYDANDTSALSCATYVVVKYAVKDSCNTNWSDTIYQVIVVLDTAKPYLVGTLPIRDTLYMSDYDVCGVDIASKTYATATYLRDHGILDIQDCNIVDALQYTGLDTVNGFCPMLLHRTYTVSDSCGNSTTFEQYIEVYDTFAPKVTDNILDTLKFYIVDTANAGYTVPAAYTTVAELIANNAAVYDCKLMEVIDSVYTDTIINKIVCEGSYILREYFVSDSCGNVSAPIHQRINLLDTVRPWLDITSIPDQNAVASVDCKFTVPCFRDTIAAHYVDNWSTKMGDYYQVPDSGYQITNYSDTVVKIVFSDSCNNWSDTIRVNILVPEEFVMDSFILTSPNCYGDYATIKVGVSGGTTNYTYSYGVPARDIVTRDSVAIFDSLSIGDYTITVTDAHGCTVTKDTTITQPTEVSINPHVYGLDTCFGDTSRFVIEMTGGIADYNVFAVLLDEDRTTVLDTVLYPTSIATTTGTLPLNPAAGIRFLYFYGEDSHHCSKDSISDTIRVWPTYITYQKDRKCHKDIASGYDWTIDTIHGIIKHIDASVFSIEDSTYVFDTIMHSVHTCDSVTRLTLIVDDSPFFKIRKLSDASGDMSNLQDVDVFYDTLHTSQTNVGWEIFIENPCLDCPSSFMEIKNPVSIEYYLYYYNTDDSVYTLMGNVHDYFKPIYHTYMDNWTMTYTDIDDAIGNSSEVHIPSDYGPLNTGTSFDYEFFNLCWFAPDYDETQFPGSPAFVSGVSPVYGDGVYYQDERENTIKISSFVRHGDYKIVAVLHKRVAGGGGFTPSYNATAWGYSMPYVIGGANSIMGDPYNAIEINFHVDGPDNLAPMPVSPSIGGAVVYTSNREVEASAHVYPNPARDLVQVELSGFEGQTEVMLSASTGMTLQTISLNIADAHSTPIVRIETGDYAQGVYMITIRNRETVITKRVVLVR